MSYGFRVLTAKMASRGHLEDRKTFVARNGTFHCRTIHRIVDRFIVKPFQQVYICSIFYLKSERFFNLWEAVA